MFSSLNSLIVFSSAWRFPAGSFVTIRQTPSELLVVLPPPTGQSGELKWAEIDAALGLKIQSNQKQRQRKTSPKATQTKVFCTSVTDAAVPSWFVCQNVWLFCCYHGNIKPDWRTLREKREVRFSLSSFITSVGISCCQRSVFKKKRSI